MVDSYGGVGKLAVSTSLNRENLYRMRSTKGNPEFFSLSTVLDSVGFRLAVEPKTAALSKTKSRAAKLVLHANRVQVKESAASYALAAASESRAKIAISLRTSDDNEVGTLDFDYNEGALILQVTGDIPLKRVQEAEIQTHDGKILSGGVSVEGKNRLVLLRNKKIFPKDILQITLSIAGKTMDNEIKRLDWLLSRIQLLDPPTKNQQEGNRCTKRYEFNSFWSGEEKESSFDSRVQL